tara:strand:- start:325 stop:996 length:672 start_codon:yes stop_codon:yes gene_type:complete
MEPILISSLEKQFTKYSNPTFAKQQKLYMRNQFNFYGLTAKQRREIQKPLFKEYITPLTNLKKTTEILWKKDKRDHQYCAQELILQNINNFNPEDIYLFEYIITAKSWWDTIDFIAPKILGEYFKLYPEKTEKQIEKWLFSNNIWLQRSCLLFQLKYKQNLNTELLTHIIRSLLDSKEFFINKAIGWILREYSKTNQAWVSNFVKKTKLHHLSTHEALKFINK